MVNNYLKIFAAATSVIIAVFFLSFFSVTLQGHKEEGSGRIDMTVNDTMTIAQFGEINGISNPVLKEVLELSSKSDLQKTIHQTGLSNEQITQRFGKQLTLKAEYESRNWIKIPLKFALTIAMLILVFVLLRKGKITSKMRLILLGTSALVFGVVLGSDPNPMGTVKDAIVLFGTKHVIFPPRMVALGVFLLMVIVANKFICSWACQFGTLQDLFFRLGRKNEGNVILQFKVPFVLTNSIRIAFFVVLSIIAIFMAVDIVSPIDPFKVFNPGKLTIAGSIFVGVILVASIFVYRPWCHFFCPFGLIGWLAEKISIFKIKVNYNTCIVCRKCEKACPSTVMGAILKRDKVIPDCFSCGTCISVCPTKSISFSKGKRSCPPVGKFKPFSDAQQANKE
jgi:NAD-dependent dihydropyrimidine dehydrogenase PreA subunit